MKKFLFSIILAVTATATLVAPGAMAQDYQDIRNNQDLFSISDNLNRFKQIAHFERIPEYSSWVRSVNPAGLMRMPLSYNKGLSYVESYLDFKDGDFVKYYQSSNNYTFGVRTESYTRVKNVATHGFLEYSSFRGHNMTWSGVIDPERLTNFTGDTVAASKRQEWYKAGGGVAFNPLHNFTLGANVTFEASNVAKMRDLRHNTTFSHLSFEGGAKYSMRIFEFGVSYLYRKYTEDVDYEQISDETNLLKGNWFKGLFFGIHNIWDYDALQMKSKQTFINKYSGVSGQFELKTDALAEDRWGFYNEFTYLKRKGQTGEGGVDPVYSKEKGEKFSYLASIEGAAGSLSFYINYDKVANNDKITTTQTLDGITSIVEYGQAKVFERREHRWGLALKDLEYAEFGFEHWTRFSNSSYVMPLYYTQRIKRNTFYFKLKDNVILQNTGMLDFHFGMRFNNGWGTKLTEHTANESVIITSGKPEYNDYLLSREFEYYTKPNREIFFGVRYSHFLSQKFVGRWYIDLSASFTKAKHIVIADGKRLTCLKAAVGIDF